MKKRTFVGTIVTFLFTISAAVAPYADAMTLSGPHH